MTCHLDQKEWPLLMAAVEEFSNVQLILNYEIILSRFFSSAYFCWQHLNHLLIVHHFPHQNWCLYVSKHQLGQLTNSDNTDVNKKPHIQMQRLKH